MESKRLLVKRVILLASPIGLNPVVTQAATPTAPLAFVKCQAWHGAAPDAAARVGPNLWGVGGAKVGGRAGYAYSPALKVSKLVWTKGMLDRYLANPAAMFPGTGIPKVTLIKAEHLAPLTFLATLK